MLFHAFALHWYTYWRYYLSERYITVKVVNYNFPYLLVTKAASGTHCLLAARRKLSQGMHDNNYYARLTNSRARSRIVNSGHDPTMTIVKVT